MKITFVFFIFISVVFTLPLDESKDAHTLEFENDKVGVDGYKYAFKTSDGVQREEAGELKNLGTENEALTVHGKIEWIAADGQQYSLTYIADENGFQPQGDHIPKA